MTPFRTSTTALLAALLPIVVNAQDDAPTTRLDTVTVSAARQSAPDATGSKTDTPPIEVPQSIVVIPREQLDAQNPQTIKQALRYAQGVTAEPGGADPRFDDFLLRGFDSISSGDYRDGLRQLNSDFAYFKTEPYGLERINVLLGPASVLYGQAGPGGLVDRISKLPSATPLYEAQLQYGKDDRYQGQFDIGGALDTAQQWRGRLTGLARESGTQFDFVPDDRRYLAPALTWQPDARTSLTLLGHYERDSSSANPFYYNDPQGRLTDHLVIDPAYDFFVQTQQQVGWRFEHVFDDTLRLRQNARYGHIDLDVGYVDAVELETDGHTLDRAAYAIRQNMDSYQADTQAEARFTTGALRHTMLAGVDLTAASYGAITGSGPATPLDLDDPHYGSGAIAAPAFSSHTRVSLNQIGVYAQEQARYARWIFTGGLRRDRAETTLDDADGTGQPPQIDYASTGRIGLVYRSAIGLAPYASYSTSFLPNIASGADGVPFKPSQGEQSETGLKIELPRGGFVTAALFQLSQRNALTTDPDNPQFSVQKGELTSRGAELSATVKPLPGLDVIAAYTWANVKVTASSDAAGDLGKTPPTVPTHSASLWGDYSLRQGLLQGFGFGGGLRYVGTSPADEANILRNDARLLVDAAIHYDLRAGGHDYRFAVNADNVFDDDSPTCNFGFCYAGVRRTVIGSLALRW